MDLFCYFENDQSIFNVLLNKMIDKKRMKLFGN